MPRAREAKEFSCTRQFEAQALREGRRFVAGCDEAGRGALLGPLAAVMLMAFYAESLRGVLWLAALPSESPCRSIT